MENKGFINVYNFVPFPKERSKKYNDEDKHTGYIEYEIKTKTPIFIPNTSNSDYYSDDEHKSYDFFSYMDLNGKTDYQKDCAAPIIPGSEIRGMVRSIYETLTGSCMGVLNSETHPIKRTAEVFKAGLIGKGASGRLFLYKADDYIYRTGKKNNYKDAYLQKDFKEGQHVYFERKDRSKNSKFSMKPLAENLQNKSQNKSAHEGYIIKGMPSPETENRKHNAHVFERKGNNAIWKLVDEDIRRLKAVIESYQAQPGADESYKEYKKELLTFLETPKGYFPVYYSIIGKNIYLSPAAITKELSYNSIGELAGKFDACSNVTDSCPACDLFGIIGNNNEECSKSKVRFADVYVADKKSDNREYYTKPITLPELSSPKLSNVEFYLKRPNNAKFWTYDYYVSQDGRNTILNKPELRGRKFYYNQPKVTLSENVEPNNRNMTVRPVKTGITFKGKMYFDNISDKQLSQLIWILNCGNHDANEGDIIFKIGAGKPVGLGSIELVADRIMERKLVTDDSGNVHYVEQEKKVVSKDNKNSISNNQADTYEVKTYDENAFIAESDCKKAFMNMVSFEKMKNYKITYPVCRESDIDKAEREGFEWFVNNHKSKSMKRFRTDEVINICLPQATGMNEMNYDSKRMSDSSYNRDNNMQHKPKSNRSKNKNYK